VVTACGFARDGNGPLAVAFGGYALANIGFLWLAWRVIPSNPMGLRQGFNLVCSPWLEKTTRFSDEIPARVYHLSPFAC
jgi:hypothetical protein